MNAYKVTTKDGFYAFLSESLEDVHKTFGNDFSIIENLGKVHACDQKIEIIKFKNN